MKFKDIFITDIDSCSKSEFQISIIKENISRIKIFSTVVIVIELAMTISDIITSILKVDSRFRFDQYLVAYIIMIFTSILFFIFISKNEDLTNKTEKNINFIENVMLTYITIILCWGSVISLLDQKLYGQPVVFMINMIVCSILFFTESKKLILPYVSSLLILFIGLPFFQYSKDVLIGHYVNLSIFIVISFICSRIIFYNYCHDFKNKILINKMHMDLQKLSYLDELTCLPNRRSLNSYIESKFLGDFKPNTMISVIMIDIDSFKLFNDRDGHIEGDKVLIEVAEQINSSVVDSSNFAARIGGEEFIYISENSNLTQTLKIAEELRKRVINLEIPHESSEHKYLTISLGISQIILTEENNVYKCIEFADKALYNAKVNGKNCMRIFDYRVNENGTDDGEHKFIENNPNQIELPINY